MPETQRSRLHKVSGVYRSRNLNLLYNENAVILTPITMGNTSAVPPILFMQSRARNMKK